MTHQCEVCDYEFRENMPGVDTREAPFFTYKKEPYGDGHHARTLYFCSSVCLESYLERTGVQFTEPRGPNPPRY